MEVGEGLGGELDFDFGWGEAGGDAEGVEEGDAFFEADDGGVGESGGGGGFAPDFVGVGEFVDEAVFDGILGGPDFADGELGDGGFEFGAASGGDDVHEAFVGGVDEALDVLAVLIGEFFPGGAGVFEDCGVGGDDFGGDADFLEESGDFEGGPDDADGADESGGFGVDGVGWGGDVVAAGGGEGAHVDDDFDAAFGFEGRDHVMDFVGGGDGSAGGFDFDDDGFNVGVVMDGVDVFADAFDHGRVDFAVCGEDGDFFVGGGAFVEGFLDDVGAGGSFVEGHESEGAEDHDEEEEVGEDGACQEDEGDDGDDFEAGGGLAGCGCGVSHERNSVEVMGSQSRRIVSGVGEGRQ